MQLPSIGVHQRATLPPAEPVQQRLSACSILPGAGVVTMPLAVLLPFMFITRPEVQSAHNGKTGCDASVHLHQCWHCHFYVGHGAMLFAT